MQPTTPQVVSFYDQLAPHYHLLYEDWERSVVEQGKALSSLLAQNGVLPSQPILDAACGVGTQTIGLARLGHDISASDISPAAVERLRSELAKRNLQVRAYVDDLRTLSSAKPASFSAILACDNSVPHLLSDAEILQAFRAVYSRLQPGGLLVLSVRDYAAIPRVNPEVRPYGMRYQQGSRFLAVQVWEWEGDQYDVSIYLTTDSPSAGCSTQVLRSRYYAISIDALVALLTQAGFVNARRVDGVLFQPVVTALRPNAA